MDVSPQAAPQQGLLTAASQGPPPQEGFWLAQKRLSKGRFVWWPSGKEPTRRLQAHQAQLLLAAGNPETAAAPVWRRVSA